VNISTNNVSEDNKKVSALLQTFSISF